MPYSTWAPTTVTWETWWMVLGENKFSCSIIQRITSPFSWNYCSIWVIFQAVCRERLHRINKKLSLHSIWKQGLLKVLGKINKGHRGNVSFLGKKPSFCCVQDLSQKLLAHVSLFLWKLCYLIPHHLRVIKILEIKIIPTYLKSISINQISMMMRLIP